MIYRDHDHAEFEYRLTQALRIALEGNTALVIVPTNAHRQPALNTLGSLVGNEHPLKHALRATGDALVIEGTRGQVRIYPADHITYDFKNKRLLDYPQGTPTFLHPDVEQSV
jgi:hypothetical protein